MQLANKVFGNADELCDWVNDTPNVITVIGITNNEFMECILFYTDSGEKKQKKAEFDQDSYWENRNKNMGDRLRGTKNEEKS